MQPGLNCDRNRKLLLACKQHPCQRGCCPIAPFKALLQVYSKESTKSNIKMSKA